jgi:hypothetical protein
VGIASAMGSMQAGMEGAIPHRGRRGCATAEEEWVTPPPGKNGSRHHRGRSHKEEAIAEEETIGEERGGTFPLACNAEFLRASHFENKLQKPSELVTPSSCLLESSSLSATISYLAKATSMP